MRPQLPTAGLPTVVFCLLSLVQAQVTLLRVVFCSLNLLQGQATLFEGGFLFAQTVCCKCRWPCEGSLLFAHSIWCKCKWLCQMSFSVFVHAVWWKYWWLCGEVCCVSLLTLQRQGGESNWNDNLNTLTWPMSVDIRRWLHWQPARSAEDTSGLPPPVPCWSALATEEQTQQDNDWKHHLGRTVGQLYHLSTQ